jgi:4-diphosphocytidyl-2-C-methyl-D-erythritol kinase
VRLAAPAKVNFGLRVLGRRADGYHEIESVFLPLDLADELELEVHPAPAPEVELELVGPAEGVPADGANLAARAAERFLFTAGKAARVHLRLEKRIPAAAGLGGGSSDAGTVLRALAGSHPDALEAGALHELAAGLGADVPFFLDPRPAVVSGIGERVEPLAPGWPAWTLVLANPGLPLSTAQVYAAHDAMAPGAPPGGRSAGLPVLLDAVRGAPLEPQAGLAALLANDLEPAAVRLCPPVARLRTALAKAGARAVGLSGSGPTVFGVFGDEPEARRALERLPAPAWARVARTLESR